MNDWLDLPDLIDRVQELFDLGLHDEGLALLEQYRETYRDEWELCFLYSRAYSEQNKPRDAIKWLREGLRIEKDNADCLLGLFYAYTQMNRMPRGALYLIRAKKLYPENDLVLNALIWYYTDTGRFDRAIRVFERRNELLAYNTEALRNAGIAYERSGDHTKALRCFKTALELEPDDDDTRDILADHYITREESDKAVALYKDFLERSPNNVRAMSRLVFCLSRMGRNTEAEAAARKTFSVYPNSPVGYVDLAYVFINTEQWEKALETAEKALDVAPLDAEAWRIKGIVYSETNRITEADESFNRALSIDPDDAELMRDYYSFLRDSGRFEQMETVVDKVIQQEQPYCVEDYWFMAEYCRTRRQPLRSFHYLTLAYRSMPGEKDLIPAMPILRSYVETIGWDEAMTELARHRRMRGKHLQEGLRFLRFYGEDTAAFRNYVFTVYLKQALLIGALILSAFFTVVAGFVAGMWGALAVAAAALLGIPSGIALVRFAEDAMAKYRRLSAEQEDDTPFDPEAEPKPDNT